MTGISLKDTIFLFNKPSAFIDTKGGGFLKKGFLLRKVEQQALLNKDREKGTLRSVEDEEPQASGQKDKNSQATTTKEDVSKIPPLEVMEPPPPLKKHTPGAARGEKSGGGAAKQDQWICWNCHASDQLLRCGGCDIGLYCDKECQDQDWGRHRRHCLKLRRRREMK